MFKIEIKNLQNILTNQAEFLTEQECLTWLNDIKLTGAFGKLEREVKEIAPGILDNMEDISKSVSSRQEEIMGEMVTFHTLPQEFTHTITDVTALRLTEKESNEAKQYLNSTDWMVLRHIRQKALNDVASLSDEQYLQLETSRKEAALKVLPS